MSNNEKKYKLIKSKGNLYKKTKNKYYPAMNLGDSINMALKFNNDIWNFESNNIGSEILTNMKEQRKILGVQSMAYNINKNDIYKNMLGTTTNFNRVIEGLTKREDLRKRISLLPDSSRKQFLKSSVQNNIISNLDAAMLGLDRPLNKKMNSMLISTESIAKLNFIEKGYYKNYADFKYKDNEVYRKDKLTEEYVNVNDIDILEEISNNKSLDIDREAIFDFIYYSQEYPMLLNKHEVGEKIFNYTKRLKAVDLSKEIYLYRMRTSEKENALFSHEEMLKPPYGISEGGRYDQYGNSVLYTTDSLKISMLETYSKNNGNKFYIARKFKYMDTLKLADLTEENEWIDTLLRKKESKQAEEYIIPRYVAQCLKYNEFDGFIVRSIHSRNDEKNYIFFDYMYNNFIRIKDYQYTDKQVEEEIKKYNENN